jgi:hypothetical protein
VSAGPGGGPAAAPPAAPDPRPPAGVSRHGWFAGVVAVLLLAWVSVNALRSEGPGSEGVRSGARLPPFAAPLALGPVEGDVNVARRAGQGAAGSRPACAVRGPGILNVCALWARGPVVLAFLATRGARCTGELDVLERARRAHPGVQFAAVSIRGERAELRALVRHHGWGFPVGHDRDGVLANLYGVAVCPHLTYALPGGRVTATSVGTLGADALERRLDELERGARAAGWRTPRR